MSTICSPKLPPRYLKARVLLNADSGCAGMEEGRIRRAELVGAKAPSPWQALTLLVQLDVKPNPPLQLSEP